MGSIFYSNRIEKLFDHLKRDLYAQSSPFLKRLVVVPSPLMKSWINYHLVNESKVSFGLKFCYLSEALHFLYKDKNHLPTQLELSFAIESKIEECLNQNKAVWNPLKKYLGSLDSHKGRTRLVHLAGHLAGLFHQYGIYAGKMVEEWEKEPTQSWQQQLWKELFKEWTYPAKRFSKPYVKEENIEVFVFGMSSIPPIYFQFLQQFSHVHYYSLSPCSVFWTDTCSDKEIIAIQKQWEAQGLSISQQEAAEEFLMDRNTILANNGKLGRKQALQFEESGIDIHAEYEICAEVLNETAYHQLAINENVFVNESRKTLLQCIQADLVLLRPQSEKIQLEFDDSISIHESTSRLREIENLYDTVMRYIAQSNEPICPKDIIVMAPDISKYEPYIKSVFGNEESQLDFQIYDLKTTSESSLSQGFITLLNLGGSRWEASAILKLFENLNFQNAFSLSKEDVNTIKKWMIDTNIHWGVDEEHKRTIFQKENVKPNLVNANGTWEKGISKLILGSVYADTENEFDNEVPSEPIENSYLNVMSKFIKIIRSLKNDLDAMSDMKISLKEWAYFLQTILDTYFYVSREEENEKSAIQTEIASLSISQNDSTYNWNSVKVRLEEVLNSKSLTFRENHLQSVCFCSMLPMRAIPGKIIALIGMQEGAFPKRTTNDSLNLMTDSRLIDYCPAHTEYDRYLFLEAVLSTRNHLILSYCSDESADLSSSIMISEFVDYINSQYEIPIDKYSRRHFFKGYDRRNFSSPNRSFSNFYFKLASAQERNIYNKAPEVLQGEVSEKNIYVVNVKELAKLSKNPLKFYCNHTLEIYLDEQKTITDDVSLSFDFLQKYQIRKKALEQGFKEIFDYEEKSGNVPAGIFQEVSRKHIHQEVEEIFNALDEMRIDYEKRKTIVLDPHCESVDTSEDSFIKVPSIEVVLEDGKHCRIVGEIPNVCNQGYLSLKKYSKKEIFSEWGTLVVLNELKDISGGNIVFARSGKKVEFPQGLNLRAFLNYYFKALKNPSPLLPDSIQSIIDGKEVKFGNDFSIFEDPYSSWFDLNRIDLDFWREIAQETFSEGILV